MAPDLKTSPVCIIGNLNIDLIIRDVPGMPAWGQEVFGRERLQVSSGQAGYLAFALRRQGIPVRLIANVGDDLYGRQILDDLTHFGVETGGVKVETGRLTGITVAMVRGDGERAFVSELGCLRDFTEKNIEMSWGQTQGAAVVCLVGLFCLPGLDLPASARALGKARAEGKLTMLDTGWDTNNWPAETLAGIRGLLSQVSLFMPNWDEAHAISGADTVEEAARALQELGPAQVVVKCGERGSYARFGAESAWVKPRAVNVLDAVGAGDVFNAGFLFGLLRGWPVPACLAWGNTTASLYISRKQDRFPGRAEVELPAREYPELAGILDQSAMTGEEP